MHLNKMILAYLLILLPVGFGVAADMSIYKERVDYDYQTDKPVEKITKTEEQWQDALSEEVFYITREQGTEPAFSGAYNKLYDEGVYSCASCGHELFSSRTKFDSKTGWPSYWSPISNISIETLSDFKLFFIERVEVICQRCGAHLGHVFKDGPKDKTGLRYCINSLALKFKPATAATKEN